MQFGPYREESKMRFTKHLTAIAVASLIAPSAWATNGYFSHGVGQKSKGMGGAGVAFPQDSMAAGTNPAGMALVGTRLDFGIEVFRPIRDAWIDGNTQPPPPGGLGTLANGHFDGSDSDIFVIPEFGYNRVINDKWTAGVSVFGNGGMNTDYKDGVPMFNFGPSGSNRTGIDLAQLFVVPTFTYKINQNHAIGVGVNLVGQRFKAKGLDNFGMMSSSPNNLTGNGYDYSYGAGVRVGWIGQFTDWLSVGATYSSKTSMSDFDDYKGLFAEQGGFDIPANYAVGLAIKPHNKLTVAFDVMYIDYEDINSISNEGPATSSKAPPFLGGPMLGDDDGWGFGWRDQWVYKLGLSYEYNPEWTFRAGWNHGSAPITDGNTLFNILAPATVEDHLTLGATWAFAKEYEVTFHYMHAFQNKISGDNSIPDWLGGGEADIEMHQDSFGISFGMKL